MTSTVFTSGTVIESPWLNDVNAATYNGGAVYTPAGTGAVPTTVQAKLRESVSVLDFGAVGNGTTDDTAAINAAIAAANGKTLYFPAGTYTVTTATFSSIIGSSFVGDRLKSIITVATDIDAWTFDTTCSGLTFDGLTFVGASTGILGKSALRIKAPRTTVQNCRFSNFNNGCLIDSEVANYCTVTENIFEDMIGAPSGNGYGCYNIGNYNRITNNTFKNIGRHAIYLSGSNPVASTYCVVANNTVDVCGSQSIVAYANAGAASLAVKGNLIIGNVVKNSVGIGIGLDQNALDNVITGNMVYGADTGTMTYGIYLNGSTAATTYPTRNIISNNYVTNAATISIGGYNSISNLFIGNTCATDTGTPTTYGILVGQSGTPTVLPEGNLIVGNKFVNVTNTISAGVNTSGVYIATISSIYDERWVEITSGATTIAVNPQVSGGGKNYLITNASPVVITNFTGATDGQEITLRFSDGNTTITQANAALAGGVNFVSSASDMLTLVYRASGTIWFEKCRSIN